MSHKSFHPSWLVWFFIAVGFAGMVIGIATHPVAALDALVGLGCTMFGFMGWWVEKERAKGAPAE